MSQDQAGTTRQRVIAAYSRVRNFVPVHLHRLLKPADYAYSILMECTVEAFTTHVGELRDLYQSSIRAVDDEAERAREAQDQAFLAIKRDLEAEHEVEIRELRAKHQEEVNDLKARLKESEDRRAYEAYAHSNTKNVLRYTEEMLDLMTRRAKGYEQCLDTELGSSRDDAEDEEVEAGDGGEDEAAEDADDEDEVELSDDGPVIGGAIGEVIHKILNKIIDEVIDEVINEVTDKDTHKFIRSQRQRKVAPPKRATLSELDGSEIRDLNPDPEPASPPRRSKARRTKSTYPLRNLLPRE